MLPSKKRRGKKGCSLAVCPICNLANSQRPVKIGAEFAYDHRLRGVHFTLANNACSTKADCIEDFDLRTVRKRQIAAVRNAHAALGPFCVSIMAIGTSLDAALPT